MRADNCAGKRKRGGEITKQEAVSLSCAFLCKPIETYDSAYVDYKLQVREAQRCLRRTLLFFFMITQYTRICRASSCPLETNTPPDS